MLRISRNRATTLPISAFPLPTLKIHPEHKHAQLTSPSLPLCKQAIHSVALLVASRAAPDNTLAGGLFTAGMTMFSGSIYALVVDPARFRFLGPITPLGGLCLIGGWVALGFS